MVEAERMQRIIGRNPLPTKTELRVLNLLATRMSPNEMAEQMRTTVSSTNSHIRSVYSKLRVHSRWEAVLVGVQLGYIDHCPICGTKPTP